LHDVEVDTPADNEVLAYDSASSLWKNQTAAEAGLAAASHTHATADVTSGTFDIARIPTGTTSTTVALGNHGHTIANVTGLQSALDGKAASSHTHAIADVTDLQTTLDAKAVAGSNGTPYRMAAGLTSTFAGSTTITFPTSRFSVAPIVTATPSTAGSQMTSATVSGVTSTGATLYGWNGTSANSTARAVYWQAIQMTSGAAAG
jgi:hypothetical protein